MRFDTALTPPYQQTLAQPVTLQDVGLHSGKHTTLRLLPAAPHAGLTFIRTDLPVGQNIIIGSWDNVVDTRLCTVVGNVHGARVGTVEHLLAALAGLGVDNCTIEIDGAEVPALDGSAAPFMAAILTAGLVSQAAPRRALEILRPVTIEENGRSASLAPAAHSDWSMTVDYTATNARIGRQTATLRLTPDAFRDEISEARTFTLYEELDAMWQSGLGLGGSLDNAVVVWGDEIVNLGGLRFDTEFARHKLLDAIGDLSLAGGPILGAYTSVAGGHALNSKLLQAVFADSANYRWADELSAELTQPLRKSA